MRGVSVFVFVPLGLFGCSSSTPAADGGNDAQVESGGGGEGGSDAAADARVPPRAAVLATYNPADAGCSGTILSVGQLPNMLVDDGPMASIACSVHPKGQMFDATVTINAVGSPAGMDLIATVSATGPQMVNAMLRDMTGMPIMKMMCTGDYPMNGGVSAGKIWIKLTCMQSIDPPPSGCPVEVEVRVENCGL